MDNKISFAERVEKAKKFFGIKVQKDPNKNPFIIEKTPITTEQLNKAALIFEKFEEIEHIGESITNAVTEQNSRLEKAVSFFEKQNKELLAQNEMLIKANEVLAKDIDLIKGEIEKIGNEPNPSKSIVRNAEVIERFEKSGKIFNLKDTNTKKEISNLLLSKATQSGVDLFSKGILALEAGAPLPKELVIELSKEGINIVQ